MDHDPNLHGISPECPGCMAERWKAMIAALREMASADPDALRAVLSEVFDVDLMVSNSAFAKRVSQEALTMANSAKRAAEDAAKRLDELHAGMDTLALRMKRGRDYLENLSEKVGRAFSFLKQVRGGKAEKGKAG